MKRVLLLSFFFISFATISQAQINKGSILLGGGIGFGKSNDESPNQPSSENTHFSINSSIGVAIKDNWVIGVNTSFSAHKSKTGNSDFKGENSGFSTGIFVRRYFPLGNNFYLYGEGDVHYFKRKNENSNSTDAGYIINTKGGAIALTPGVSYALRKRLYLEASLYNFLYLSYSKTDTEELSIGGITKSETKNFSFRTNLSTNVPISLGFRFVLAE